jgi:hypothetical protein
MESLDELAIVVEPIDYVINLMLFRVCGWKGGEKLASNVGLSLNRNSNSLEHLNVHHSRNIPETLISSAFFFSFHLFIWI